MATKSSIDLKELMTPIIESQFKIADSLSTLAESQQLITTQLTKLAANSATLTSGSAVRVGAPTQAEAYTPDELNKLILPFNLAYNRISHGYNATQPATTLGTVQNTKHDLANTVIALSLNDANVRNV
ncbi:MAG: hypothetical protein RL757_2457 [Bacteroidota bacterium]|jgi:hypothetical protein